MLIEWPRKEAWRQRLAGVGVLHHRSANDHLGCAEVLICLTGDIATLFFGKFMLALGCQRPHSARGPKRVGMNQQGKESYDCTDRGVTVRAKFGLPESRYVFGLSLS
jgi:hypothetical protein